MFSAMVYTKEETDLINSLYDTGETRENIAHECNSRFYQNRPIRTARGIEAVLLEKLFRRNDRFQIKCEVCGKLFRSGWPNSRYCCDACRAVVDREYANNLYHLDPRKNIQKQSVRIRERINKRWKIIIETKGDRCSICGKQYPFVVYDLHHPNGKHGRKETPSKIIRVGTDSSFYEMLNEVQILCPICHRLLHAKSGNLAPIREGMQNVVI